MRFYLISLACTNKPTPSLFPYLSLSLSQVLLSTSVAHQVALYVPATATPTVPSFSSSSPLIFIHSFASPISIFLRFNPKKTRTLSCMHVRSLNARSINLIARNFDSLHNIESRNGDSSSLSFLFNSFNFNDSSIENFYNFTNHIRSVTEIFFIIVILERIYYNYV